MNKPIVFLAVLLCTLLAGHSAAGHASEAESLVRALRAPQAARGADQAFMAIPSNTLTGQGAIATPDGRIHY